MIARDPSYLLGKYFVPHTLVKSVFTDPVTLLSWCLWRDWPFLVTKVLPNGFEAINTTTKHVLIISMDEILGCYGDDNLPPNYFRPLTLRLTSQICWNNIDLWRESLWRTRRRKRTLH